ncbi:MAG: hypothetical protein PUH24_09685 [Prevotellaceae bacterium]|nr:hypothetical protein [Prevotellaceae bacterium]MDY6131539.1 hypothetical protein [Prevotella sp.]
MLKNFDKTPLASPHFRPLAPDSRKRAEKQLGRRQHPATSKFCHSMVEFKE